MVPNMLPQMQPRELYISLQEIRAAGITRNQLAAYFERRKNEAGLGGIPMQAVYNAERQTFIFREPEACIG